MKSKETENGTHIDNIRIVPDLHDSNKYNISIDYAGFGVSYAMRVNPEGHACLDGIIFETTTGMFPPEFHIEDIHPNSVQLEKVTAYVENIWESNNINKLK